MLQNFNQNQSAIFLSCHLKSWQLPEELQGLNNAAYDGAYTPPLPDPVEFEAPELSGLPQDIQDQLLDEQLQAELDEEARAALEAQQLDAQQDDHGSIEDEEPIPEVVTDPNSPDFQMPVF